MIYFFILCMSVLSACMSLCMCVCMPHVSEDVRTGVRDSTSCRVGAENHKCSPQERKCSEQLSHLSNFSPQLLTHYLFVFFPVDTSVWH